MYNRFNTELDNKFVEVLKSHTKSNNIKWERKFNEPNPDSYTYNYIYKYFYETKIGSIKVIYFGKNRPDDIAAKFVLSYPIDRLLYDDKEVEIFLDFDKEFEELLENRFKKFSNVSIDDIKEYIINSFID